jgi:Ca2+-binding RTX toxin-like protein
MVRRKSRSKARLGAIAGAAVAALVAFPGAANAAVNSSVTNGDLVVSSDAADPITITSVEVNGVQKVKINGNDPGNGAADSATIDSIVVTGDGGANNIDLSGVDNPPFTMLGSITVNGGGGNDTIVGSKLADTINGGDGNDSITPDDNPANTQDVARGDAGDDTIVWNGGDDNDVNVGGADNDTTEVNGAAAGETFTVKPSAALPGGVRFDRVAPDPPGPFNIEISGDTERLDLNAAAGDDNVTADPGFASLKLDVEGGDGNDTLDGGDAADLLSGGNGNDSLTGDNNPAGTRDESRGDAGDDTMVWNPGDGDDVNEGGDGNDTTEVNGGGDEEFEVAPAQVPGRVFFQRLNPAPFSVDIGTTENLRLNAGDGDDKIKGKEGLAGLIKSTLNGDDGNDRIKGTDGEDLLTGGKGFDVIRSRDNAADQVEGDGGFDIAFVDERDTVRAVEIVLGGNLRVRHLGGNAVNVAGNAAAVRLQAVATRRASGRVHLMRGGKSLGSAKYKVTRKPKRVRIQLNRRGLRLVARAPRKGLSAKLRIDARDSNGNGWRTSKSIKLKR